MRKLLSVLLAILMLVPLSACGFMEVAYKDEKNGSSDVVIQTETGDPTDIPGADGSSTTPITSIPEFLVGEWKNEENGVTVRVNEISADKKRATVAFGYYDDEVKCTLVNGELEFFSEYDSLSGKFTFDVEKETLTLFTEEWKKESELEGKKITLSKVETAYMGLADIPYGDYVCASKYSDAYLVFLVSGRGENSLNINLWNHSNQSVQIKLELTQTDSGIVFMGRGYSISGRAFTTSNGMALVFEEGIKVSDISITRGVYYFEFDASTNLVKNTSGIEASYAGYWDNVSYPIVSFYWASKGYDTIDGEITVLKNVWDYVDIPFLFGETNGNVITITDTDGNEIGSIELAGMRRYNGGAHYYEDCIILTLDIGEPGAPNIIERLLVMSAKG